MCRDRAVPVFAAALAALALAMPASAAGQFDLTVSIGVPVTLGGSVRGVADLGPGGMIPVTQKPHGSGLPVTLGLRSLHPFARGAVALALEGAFDFKSVRASVANADPGDPAYAFEDRGQLVAFGVRLHLSPARGGSVRPFVAAGPAVLWHAGDAYRDYSGRWAFGGNLGGGVLVRVGTLQMRVEVADVITSTRLARPDLKFERAMRHLVLLGVGAAVLHAP